MCNFVVPNYVLLLSCGRTLQSGARGMGIMNITAVLCFCILMQEILFRVKSKRLKKYGFKNT